MGLSCQLQDAMAGSQSERPTQSLDDYANWWTKLDEQLSTRHTIRNAAKTGSKPPANRPVKFLPISTSQASSSASNGDAMQLDAANLPYKHKKTGGINYGHCWKCGQRGHNALKCLEDSTTSPKFRSLTAAPPELVAADDSTDDSDSKSSKN
ncbi:MAG: hypothetical protein SEPTF4163_006370 [Sporothrix epigloea]